MSEFATPLSEKEREVIEKCPMDIYTAFDAPFEYPYKLVKPSYSYKRILEHSDVSIMDSGIGDEVSNREVLNAAEDADADYVVAKDFLGNKNKTTKSIRDFWYQYDKHEYGGRVLIPLQEDHVRHYDELNSPDSIVIGGIKDKSVSEKKKIMKNVRDAAGENAYIHALGLGMSSELVSFFKENPGIVDAIDCSSAMMAVANNKVTDATLKEKRFVFPKGKNSSVFSNRMVQYVMIQLNYLIGPFSDMDRYNRKTFDGSVFNY